MRLGPKHYPMHAHHATPQSAPEEVALLTTGTDVAAQRRSARGEAASSAKLTLVPIASAAMRALLMTVTDELDSGLRAALLHDQCLSLTLASYLSAMVASEKGGTR